MESEDLLSPSVSEMAITALAAWPPAPPCCLQHSKENLANPDRDSDSSIITTECVGQATWNEGLEIPFWAVGMTGKELEIRIKILNIQQSYREKQRELLEVRKKLRKTRKKPTPLLTKNPPKHGRKRRHSCGSSASQNGTIQRSVNGVSVSVGLSRDGGAGAGVLEEEASENELLNGEIKEEMKGQGDVQDSFRDPAVLEAHRTSPALENSLPSAPNEENNQEEEHNFPISNCPTETHNNRSKKKIRLDQEDLKNGLRLILLEGGLFYPGTLEVLDDDALLYGVSVDGQRASRPYVLCQEELLATALKEVKVRSVECRERICAFWSGQLQGLYPGSVTEFKASAKSKAGEQLVTINFDDGDSGQIRISDVRALPEDFPITKIESPVLPAFITRKRSSRAVDPGPDSHGPTEAKTSRSGSFPQVSLPKKQKSTMFVGSNSEQQKCPIPISVWEWEGSPSWDSKKRLPSFSAIRKGDVLVKVGDLVQLRSDARFGGSRSPTTGHNIYVGFVKKLWETKTKTKKVRVAWCYRSNEVEQISSVRKLLWPDRAVFTSPHTDDNSIETISCRCDVVSWQDFNKKTLSGEDVGCRTYYVAGSYDPVNKRVKIEADLTT